jgi:uncharacterized protein with PIN domain
MEDNNNDTNNCQQLVDLLSELQEKIRKTQEEFREPNDNSDSLFTPEKGFVEAYNKEAVNNIVNQFRIEVSNALIQFHATGDEALLDMAKQLGKTSSDPATLNFVEKVERYIEDNKDS